ncbi:MAG TPA: hypothetical protein PLD20_05900 [Blastocatellia bacterium]|nr:hypothetical protein [Blastocatellia bacterium]HMX28915.1 hypothetical protein [Blastocatellia bacterium]HMY70850.1 hypothetical protein [Blastocatellia bacterium]HMZ17441.1 hypothetical protein [Blastocatellia bacterium]HNG28775.1 hypothetical protein [Blastocatellia bacterium]
MSQASFLAQTAIIAMVAVLAFLFIFALSNAAPNRKDKSRWAGIGLWIVAAYLGISSLLAESGILREFERRPPPFLLMAFGFTFATAVLAFSPVGTRLVSGAGIAGLIAFQAFRIPVELWLHRLYQEGVVPVQMTYSGRNFDILSGVLGLGLGLWAARSEPPRWTIWLFNVVGLALLINIVTIAILSAPVPMRRFFNEPANTFVADWPFVWLPAFLVQAAWLGHLLVFRWLRHRS